MSPVDRASVGHPGLFISCAFPPSGVTQLCAQMASALGFEPILADAASPTNPRDKVLDLMKGCDATLFVLELDKEMPGGWQSAELGYAVSLDHHLAFIYCTQENNQCDFHKPARDIEPLILDGDPTSTESHVAVASYLSSLRTKILKNAHGDEGTGSPLRYESVTWSVRVNGSGYFSYSNRFICEAVADGVGDVDHWMNANPRLPDPIEARPRDVVLIENGAPERTLTLRPLSGDDRVFRFGWEINPPLRYGDRLLYEYRVTPNNGPITKEWWKGRKLPIRHMYNVTLPMHSLLICVTSELGVGFKKVDAKAYVGLRVDDWTENRRESTRSRNGIHQFYAGGNAVATVDVKQPLMGHTYCLEWEPDW